MTYEELKYRQSWTLNQKIDHALGVIDQFHSRLDGKVYVSDSGGKDSAVLSTLVRKIFPDVLSVFCNTGNEYPDIVKFIRSKENVKIIYPEMKPEEVFLKYGFPLISKEQAMALRQIKTTKSEKLKNYRMFGNGKNKAGVLSGKWFPLINEPFMVSEKCCEILKKRPFKKFERETGLYPILGLMADESILRQTNYINRGGCNSFDSKRISSHPLSIFTEQDIWCIIKMFNIPISAIYPKGAKRTGCMFCGFGCQFKEDNRLQLVYELYSKMYNMFMNYTNNDVTYREAMRKVLAINGICLPDENKQLKLDL